VQLNGFTRRFCTARTFFPAAHQIATISARPLALIREGDTMTKFKVLGGDFDRGEGSLSATHEFYLRKDKKELPAIPPNQVQEVDQATEASLDWESAASCQTWKGHRRLTAHSPRETSWFASKMVGLFSFGLT
jgi:hypothetical protein